MLMGHIQYEKNTTKKLLFYIVNALLFILNFYVIFVGAFGETAVNQTLALGELPLHNPYPATIGRLEWLTIIIWSAILLIQGAMLGNFCCKCIKCVFNVSDIKIPAIATTIIISGSLVASYLQLYNVLKLVTSTPFVIISGVFHTLLVIVLLIAFAIEKRRGNMVNKHNIKEVKLQC